MARDPAAGRHYRERAGSLRYAQDTAFRRETADGIGRCHASLGEMDESEEDLLDRTWGLETTSRLSCQAILSNQDVTIEIPKYSINHAKERV